MKIVLVEAPSLLNPVDEMADLLYLDKVIRNCFDRLEAPFVSHLLNKDIDPFDHIFKMKISKIGLGLLSPALLGGTKIDLVAIYVDYGLSPQTYRRLSTYEKSGVPIEYRNIIHKD